MPTAELTLLFDVIAADLRREYAAGRRPRVKDYASTVPELFADPELADQLRGLEDDLRNQTPPPMKVLDIQATLRGPVRPVPPSVAVAPEPAVVFPRVGDTVAGFRLTGELGRGAFGRVYLAEQHSLGRAVALKVTARGGKEAQRLARLRHTNVVPVYSVHDLPDGLQAVCMPVLGRQTLADLVADFRRTGSFAGAVSTLAQLDTKHDSSIIPPAVAPVVPPGVLVKLTGLGHVERALWMVERVAGGLAHAHAAGILHLDLKPANVLLADDGEPVLVDFNLSYDTVARERDRAGGTLPYMAPEQLDDYRTGGPPAVDERTDLFALGVVLFELLTGRPPFPVPAGRPNLRELAVARRQPPPRLRPLNKAVSPAVESIVRTLIAPRPEDRYPSAAALAADLRAHQEGRPLAVAANPSATELWAKWQRRHPRFWVPVVVAATLLLAAGLAVSARRSGAAAATADARDRAGVMAAELPRLRADLTHTDDAFTPQDRAAGVERATALLAARGLPDDPDWPSRPGFADLPAGERAAAVEATGELALLLAHAGGGEKWRAAAAAAFPGGPPVRVGLFLRAAEAAAGRRPTDAAVLLEELCRLAPADFAAQFALADARQQAGDGARAAERFAVAAALSPADPRPHFHRGRLLLTLGQPAAAVEALGTAADRRPDCWQFRFQLAVARKSAGDPAGALAELVDAIPPAVRLPFRAEVRAAVGDAAGAAADRAAAAAYEPATSLEFQLRGRTRLATDPEGAKADFDRATRLAPHDPANWLCLVHVLSERLDRPADARVAADQAVGLAPHNPMAWVTRAVVRGRQGDAAGARADADRALELSRDPAVLVRAACAVARAGDADRAAELLVRAVRGGYRDRAGLRGDPDLALVRGRADVRAALAN